MKTEEMITTATEAPKTRTPGKAPAAKKTAKPATKKASKAPWVHTVLFSDF